MATHKQRFEEKAMESALHAAATEFKPELSALHKKDALRLEMISQATHKDSNGEFYKCTKITSGISGSVTTVLYHLDTVGLEWVDQFGRNIHVTEIEE